MMLMACAVTVMVVHDQMVMAMAMVGMVVMANWQWWSVWW